MSCALNKLQNEKDVAQKQSAEWREACKWREGRECPPGIQPGLPGGGES